MATINTEFILRLDEEDVTVLKKVLGGMTDNEFSKLGVIEEDRKRMSAIWRLLPYISKDHGNKKDHGIKIRKEIKESF